MQFEVVFSDSYILEPDAYALLESSRIRSATYAPDVSHTDLASVVRESAAADASAHRPDGDSTDGGQPAETYEIISSPLSRYLCTIPTVARLPELNKTATELAKAEEAREINRASARGWELMSGLDGRCLYFISGWWSYNFCYGKEIVQFHAAPNSAGGVPVRDPNSHEYVLGSAVPSTKGRKGDVAPKGTVQSDNKGVAPPNSDLQIKGDQRYLVQRLDGGTICDLTGRPRTIEIQYHCSPGASDDRIGWIKEVTTCTYLMVVHTPRLCADVAFLPPKETRAHPISCRAIISDDDEADAWRWRKSVEAKEKMGVTGAQKAKIGKEATREHQFSGMTIGGVVVGGKNVLGGKAGEAPVQLAVPRGIAASRQSTDTWAALGQYLTNQRKKAGEGVAPVDTLTAEDLEKLGVDKETVEAVKQELERLGGEDFWQIAVEVIPPGEAAAGHEAGGGQKKPTRQAAGQGQTQNQGLKGNGNGKKQATGDAKPGVGSGQAEEEEEGSEEIFFKDEL